MMDEEILKEKLDKFKKIGESIKFKLQKIKETGNEKSDEVIASRKKLIHDSEEYKEAIKDIQIKKD